eukprot:TRINITY_DN3394_c0_g1_i1.p1 TRINITY_DN3394_c0_g1~~TRINITY_DN3394_c0_g1_i1.p1  ORF type:complete len:369 (+),score=114.14 TRINITY_DN3394_c0_g1_i1:968-2074(+)
MTTPKKKIALRVDTAVNDKKSDPYSVTKSGTLQFKDAEIEISKNGLLVKGQSPYASPKVGKHGTDAPQMESPNPHQLTNISLKDLQPISTLGRGSSGLVQKMQHTPSNTMLAVKVIQLDIKDVAVCKQIILELKTLHKTQSPHVVSFFDAFFTEGSIYIALEFMDGGTLADAMETIKSRSPTGHATIPEDALAGIAIQVLKGLEYLHKLYLVHRDIKPSNLLLSKNKIVKIADFGVSGQLAHTLSRCESWVGTIYYMSPDRIGGGTAYSYDSDVWSMGLSLLECAIGYFPYAQGTDSFFGFVEVIRKQPAPRVPSSGFSSDFADFIEECLQKAPEARPQVSSLLKHPWIVKHRDDSSPMEKWFSELYS